MKSTLQQVRGMKQALLTAFANSTRNTTANVGPYIDSVEWKLKLLVHHCRFLGNVEFSELHSIGNLDEEDEGLKITCGHSEGVIIEIRNLDAGKLVVFNALDGMVAASVNIVDTLGRMLNEVYELGIQEREANLPVVYDKLPTGAPLKLVLGDPAGVEWMKPLRRMRGECQHSVIASVVELPNVAYGGVPDMLFVRSDFQLDGMTDMDLASFADTVCVRTMELLKNLAAAIQVDPKGCCSGPS